MSVKVSYGRGKYVLEFKRGQYITLHHEQKRCKKIIGITCKDLLTVQRIIKSWKECELSTTSGECVVENQS